MNKKLGRNDSCHCGSGKKYKVCHGQDNIKSLQPWILILIIILGLFWYLLFESEPTVNNNKSNPLIPQPKNKLSLPSEPAPPGKVWSPEHNHWHDDPKASIPTSTNAEQMNQYLNRRARRHPVKFGHLSIIIGMINNKHISTSRAPHSWVFLSVW